MDDTPIATPARTAPAVAPLSGEANGERPHIVVFPSGTTLSVRADANGEDIMLRSAGGQMELRLRLTADGPVLSLHGVKLEIEAADTVAVNCREFAVNARDGVRVTSAGGVDVRSEAEIHLRSAGQTFVDGDYVNLNCLDRTGYHDHVPDNAIDAPAAIDALSPGGAVPEGAT